MALIHWEPATSLATLRGEMDRLFDDFLGAPWRRGEGKSEPAIEVADTQEAVVVKMQVPGVKKEDIHVDVRDNALTLKGEMKEEEKKEEQSYYRQEFRYGAFSRTIPLPVAVQADKAAAQLKDGVLTVTVPKSEQAKAREIPIQA